MNVELENNKIVYKDLSYQIIKLILEVHNTLGCGFLEKVYENALIIKFRKNGLEVKNQYPIKVHFESEIVGDYIADIIVENKIILELKCIEQITNINRAQMINYLKATGFKLGMVINFAKPSLEFERIVL